MEDEPKDDGKCWYLPYSTIPKTNIATENRPGPKRKFIFQASTFRCKLAVSFREDTTSFWSPQDQDLPFSSCWRQRKHMNLLWFLKLPQALRWYHQLFWDYRILLIFRKWYLGPWSHFRICRWFLGRWCPWLGGGQKHGSCGGCNGPCFDGWCA